MRSSIDRALARLRARPVKRREGLPVIDTLRLIKGLRKAIAHRSQIPMKNWKTTVFGSTGLLMIWMPVIAAAFDADPATVPNWGAAISASLPAIGLLFAKDFNVSGKPA